MKAKKKIRIGLWLIAFPYGGGIYQFNLLVLKVLERFRKLNPLFTLHCFSPMKEWETYFRENPCLCDSFAVVHSKRVGAQYLARRIAVSSRLPFLGLRLWIWRKINRYFPFEYRKVFQAKVDFMLYLAEDWQAAEIAIPSISVIFDVMQRYTNAYNTRETKLRNFQQELICKYSKTILADSRLGKKQIEDSYREVLKGEVISLYYIPTFYILAHNEAVDYSNRTTKFNLPSKYLFYPAQFWKYKNHDNLVRAVSTLDAKRIKVNVVLAGSRKDHYLKVLQLISDLNVKANFHILGYVSNEDIIALYKNAWALVMPTFSGPTNLPIIEAIYLGCPVICSNLFEMPQQIGEAGLTCDPFNSNDIAEKIEEVWNNAELRSQLAEKAKVEARKYSFEGYFTQWSDIIMEFCKRIRISPQMTEDGN
jgi:glycosyltransferase involved in cell wall biosynthesis